MFIDVYLLLQDPNLMRDIADTTIKEVTIIGLETVLIIVMGGLWFRREKNWEKKVDKLHEEVKIEVRSHSEELKKAHENAINMGTRFMTMIELDKSNRK